MADALGKRLSLFLADATTLARVNIGRRTEEILRRGTGTRPVPFLPIGRIFGDLRVRPKFMVLLNLFFLVLTAATYFSLIPFIDQRVTAAKQREIAIAARALLNYRIDDGMGYALERGSAESIALPPEARSFLRDYPDRIYQFTSGSNQVLFALDATVNGYRRLELPVDFYDDITRRVRWSLFLVLMLVYVLSVAALELMVMPRYVYSRISLFLKADEAVRRGDRDREMIPEDRILDDEIGQIMRSRNGTVAALRAHEDELAAALTTLEAQDRLASLGLLSASVAHELNTPLAVLQGSLEKLAERPCDIQTRQRLDLLLRVTYRIRKIAESLLDFARVRRQTLEPIRLHPLVQEAWDLVAIDEKASRVRFENNVGLIDTVVGNGDRLIQVFVNLLRNALAAVPSSGRILVSSRMVHEGGRWIVMKFEDSGPGIPPNLLPNIFDAFVSTRLDARGTGLGLTIAQGIVCQHGGSIHAGNREQGGAVIEVRLPAT